MKNNKSRRVVPISSLCFLEQNFRFRKQNSNKIL